MAVQFDARIEGLRALQDRIEEIAETVDTVHDQTPTFEDLFDPAFMLAYTRYATIGELLERGFGLSSAEGFMHLADDARNRLVAEHTEFPTWDTMLARAGEEWAVRWLGLAEE